MCGAGFYSGAKAISCSTCPFNYYCDSETTITGTICPDGYICPQGLSVKPYTPDYACP